MERMNELDIKEQKKGSKTTYSCRFWYYKNGVKKSKYKSGFATKKEAKTWGVDEKRKLERLREGSDKMTVEEFLDRWIRTKENKLKPTTLNGYKVNIKHINRYIGNIPLNKLLLMDVQEMADSLTEEDLKFRTVKYVIRTLHAAMNYAIKNQFIISNPAAGIEIAKDEEEFTAIVYDADTLRTLLTLLKEQEHMLYIPVLLASMRGLRRGECFGLAWKDVDFKNGLLHIRNNYVVVNKVPYHQSVKSDDSKRTTSIEGFIQGELEEYQARMRRAGQIQTYVCEVDGEIPHPSHASRILRQFQKANNLPECRFHDLRHSFAKLQLENDTDLDTLKRLLGHSKIAITSELYLQENMTLIKKATSNLDNVITLKDCDKIVTFEEK